jgi:hypothetical protein
MKGFQVNNIELSLSISIYASTHDNRSAFKRVPCRECQVIRAALAGP